MAHLVKLARRCGRCAKNATVEVFNSSNASVGVYCATCGARRLKELQAADAGSKPW